MNSIKPFFSMVNEDLDLKTMAPGLVGLYAFCQAINKVGNQSPYPIPTLDIVSTEKVPQFKSNPVHFTYSKNSFKVYINPKIGRIDFADGGGHDLIHSLTTNIAKKFARERAGLDIKNSNFGKTPSEQTSKANTYRVSPKMFQKIGLDLAQFGIDYKTFQDIQSVRRAASILDKKQGELLRDRQRDVENYPAIEKLEKLLKILRSSTISRTHFAPSVRVDSNKKVQNTSRNKYEQEYGISDDGTNFGLPQYEAEENFGNYVGNAIGHYIQSSTPIHVEEVLSQVRKNVEDVAEDNELAHFLEDSLHGKLEKFLGAVFQAYNSLLGRYSSVVKSQNG